MKTAEFKELLNRYREGKATTEEVAWLESWYMDLGKADKVAMDEAELNEAHELIWKQFAAEHQIVAIKRRLWPRIAVAAAAVAAITLGTWIYMNEVASSRKVPRNDVVTNDVAPGKNGATITLANGKVIKLSDAKSGVVVGKDLKYNDGTAISDRHPEFISEPDPTGRGSRTIQTLTASTARGQTYQFTLSDGTRVWLNANSKLEFPNNFSNSKTRYVKLSGEGYFEVAKDKAHPFVVQTASQEVEVLGTHFNINSYPDEPGIKTTLLEGSVKVGINGNQFSILKPGEQSQASNNGKLIVKAIDTEMAVAWKNNQFIFEDDNIEFIMRMVERWYNVEVIYQGNKPVKKFWGAVSRFDNISSVLRILEKTGGAKFKVEGRKVYVSQ